METGRAREQGAGLTRDGGAERRVRTAVVPHRSRYPFVPSPHPTGVSLICCAFSHAAHAPHYRMAVRCSSVVIESGGFL